MLPSSHKWGALKMASWRSAAHSLCLNPQKVGVNYAGVLRCNLGSTMCPGSVVFTSQLRLQLHTFPGYGSARFQPLPALRSFFTRSNHPGGSLLRVPSYDVWSGRSASEFSMPPSTGALESCETPLLFSDRKRKVLNGTEYIRRKTGYRGRIRRGRQAPC